MQYYWSSAVELLSVTILPRDARQLFLEAVNLPRSTMPGVQALDQKGLTSIALFRVVIGQFLLFAVVDHSHNVASNSGLGDAKGTFTESLYHTRTI